jgi:hypothetical protein
LRPCLFISLSVSLPTRSAAHTSINTNIYVRCWTLLFLDIGVAGCCWLVPELALVLSWIQWWQTVAAMELGVNMMLAIELGANVVCLVSSPWY